MTADYLKISEWRAALTQTNVPAIDVLAFDACLMAMAEVQYALRDVAEYFVGSQEVVSGDGYDYRTLFQSLVAQPYSSVGQPWLEAWFRVTKRQLPARMGLGYAISHHNRRDA